MIPLDAIDDFEEALDAGGFLMLGRVLACLVIVLLVAPLIWWAA